MDITGHVNVNMEITAWKTMGYIQTAASHMVILSGEARPDERLSWVFVTSSQQI